MNSLTNHLKQQRLLVVLAHPDDEVFCAGGLLARAAAMGAETMVVSATRGEAEQQAPTPSRPSLNGPRHRRRG